MGINGVVNKPIGFFSFAFFLGQKVLKGPNEKNVETAGLIFFLGGSEFVAWVSHCIFLWVPLMDGLGALTAPLLGFFFIKFAGFQRILHKRGRYEEERLGLLQRCFKLSMFLEKWGRWKEERGREKMFFYYLLTCPVRLTGVNHTFNLIS